MSEELLQRDLVKNPEKIGRWDYYNIGSTTVKALKEYGIVRNVDYGDAEKKKVDGLIVLEKNVAAVVEYKKPAQLKTKALRKKAVAQKLDVAKKLGAKLLIVTDSKQTFWINALTGNEIKDEDGQKLLRVFNPKEDGTAEYIEKIIYSINEKNDRLKPKELVNPTDLAKQIWQDIWSVSGATPENCLYTFVELFIFKYLSDLGVLKGIYSFATLVETFETNTAEEILENYASMIRPKIKELFPANPADKTTIINGTIFVSKDQKAVRGYSTVFKKVLQKFWNYGKLEHIDLDFKSHLFESFLKESISKKNWGQFFTPLRVVRAIVAMAKDDIKPGSHICDPACGVGKFLLEPIVSNLDTFYEVTNKGINPRITIKGFDKGFDKDEQKTIILAKANMLIYFSDLIKENPGLTRDFANLFNETFLLNTNSILGTLSDPVENKFDLILTNPPYVTSGSSNLKDEIRKDGALVDYYRINSLGVEGLFLEWIIRALKPNGKAFVVIPDGILNRQNDKSMRQFIMDECFIDAIISLPLNTFFSTSKKTYILCVTKKSKKGQIQSTPVFTYIVSEIGETRDVYRFEIAQNDLLEAVTLFNFFKGAKQRFEKINTDKRCKIQPFERFKNEVENSWVVDNWWSEQEKIVLGVLKKSEKYDLFEFSLLIDEISSNLAALKSELLELEQKKKSPLNIREFVVDELFDAKLGNPKYTKRFGNSNPGPYPVFAASNHAPLIHVNHFDYDGEYLSWARNGFAGFVTHHTGKFSINYDRGILVPLNPDVVTLYAKFVLEPILRKAAVGRKDHSGRDEFTKLYLSSIKEIRIPIPVNNDGGISKEAQLEMIERFQLLDDIKSELGDYCKVLSELSISGVDISGKYVNYQMKDLFDIAKGNSKYTNEYILTHQGNYPVFSSQTMGEGIFGNIDSYDYDQECLTWTTDGIHAGTVFHRFGRFSMTTHCGALFLKKKFSGTVRMDYLFHYLANNLRKYAISEQNKRLTKGAINEISVPIPVDHSGEIDMVTQEQIALRYGKMEEIRKRTISEIERAIGIDVEVV